MSMISKTTIVQVGIEISIFLTASIIALLLSLNKLTSLTPFIRGFFCDDQNLMYPYQEDSISTLMAIVVLIVPTLAFIFVTEAMLLKNNNSRKFNMYLRNTYNMAGCMLLGFTLCILFIEILKLYVGRLRPHFLSVCDPTMVTSNCSRTYITNYKCQGQDLEAILDSRKSFPSGHSGASWYCMTFLVTYIQLRVRTNWPKLRVVCPILQLAAISLAAYVSISRLQDYKHHAGDIIGGSLIGVIFTIAVIYQNPKARRAFLKDYSLSDFSDTMDTIVCTELHQSNSTSTDKVTSNGQT
uniref:Phospholipid phosphatase 1-like n=1 Tax=Crassostrea virginica TaxID=6565 RepID=A0A8B8DW41_CRAVI|nr:phospholipid phosphatase 1-like [Crassostrea virginica]